MRTSKPVNPNPSLLHWCHGHLEFHPRSAFPSAGKGDGSLRGRCSQFVKAQRAVADRERQARDGARLNAAREARRTPDQEAARKRDRNARAIAANGAKISAAGVLGLRPGDAVVCFWCATSTTLGHGTAAVMHLEPLGEGGQTVRGNLVPACWTCMSSKNDRPVHEWLAAVIATDTVPAAGALAELAQVVRATGRSTADVLSRA